ncbi:hypothetical protein NHX12_019182, partial [Muraenolepis orangiensis]
SPSCPDLLRRCYRAPPALVYSGVDGHSCVFTGEVFDQGRSEAVQSWPLGSEEVLSLQGCMSRDALDFFVLDKTAGTAAGLSTCTTSLWSIKSPQDGVWQDPEPQVSPGRGLAGSRASSLPRTLSGRIQSLKSPQDGVWQDPEAQVSPGRGLAGTRVTPHKLTRGSADVKEKPLHFTTSQPRGMA